MLTIPPPGGRTWRVGQIVHATVVSSTTGGQTVLNIGGNKITSSLKMEQPLQQGERLQLEVINSGTPVVLKVTASEPSPELVINRALRHLLPRQIPLENLLNNLSTLINSSSTNPATHQMITRLLAAIPQFKQLTSGKKIEQAISNSGMFLENKLAQSSSGSLNQDFKAALLRLLGSLKNAPEQIVSTTARSTEETIRQLESGLARLQTNQLNALINHGTEWFVELPIKQKNDQHLSELQVKIKQDKGSASGTGCPAWSVSLRFELQKLGPVQANITLLGDKQISIGIWAERESTAEHLASFRHILQNNLTEANLTVLNLSCHQGKMPESTSTQGDIKQQLVDITV